MFKIAIIIAISAICFAADPVQVKLPPEAAKIVAEHDAQVAKAKAVLETAQKAYNAAVVKADADGRKKLEPVVVKITKSGDLKGATETQKVLEGWKGEDMLDDKIDLDKTIVGKWKGNIGPIVQGIWTFEKGGTGNFQGNNLQSNGPQNHTFKWIIEDDKIKVDIDFKGKYFCYINLTKNDFKGTAWISTEEDSVTATRVVTK